MISEVGWRWKFAFDFIFPQRTGTALAVYCSGRPFNCLISTLHGQRTRQHVMCRVQALQLASVCFWQRGCKLLGAPTRGFGVILKAALYLQYVGSWSRGCCQVADVLKLFPQTFRRVWQGAMASRKSARTKRVCR